MNNKNKKIYISYDTFNSRWLIFLAISILFYFTWLYYLHTQGVSFIVGKMIINCLSIFLIGFLGLSFRFRRFFYIIKFSKSTFTYFNILTNKKIDYEDIGYLDADFEYYKIWIVYKDKKDDKKEPNYFSFGLIDLPKNSDKFKDILITLKDKSGAEIGEEYTRLLSFTTKQSNDLLVEYSKSTKGILGNYYWCNIRWVMYSMILLFLVSALDNGPALLPSKAYHSILIINLVLEGAIAYLLQPYIKDDGLTIENASKHRKITLWLRLAFLLISFVIGISAIVSLAPANVFFFVNVAIFYALLYYTTIGMSSEKTKGMFEDKT